MAFALSACGFQTQHKTSESRSTPKEYFAESEYGVKASPRVAMGKSDLPRGGGREHVGKPYMVKGQWYYPQEVATYSKQGKASWYGDAFHGRLTANGEIYDMTHLTAAHPTLPLPSYARVTNLHNGHSIVVRVNDRGPFSRNRIIDLSKRAAQLLDYTHKGVAHVQVDYLGPAPLHGQDDDFLMASFRPSGAGEDSLPNVMLAMNAPAPERFGHDRAGTEGHAANLPDIAPVPQLRADVSGRSDRLAPVMSYASEQTRDNPAGEALERLAAPKLKVEDVVRSWREFRLSFVARNR